jgi:hypothetical protein
MGTLYRDKYEFLCAEVPIGYRGIHGYLGSPKPTVQSRGRIPSNDVAIQPGTALIQRSLTLQLWRHGSHTGRSFWRTRRTVMAIHILPNSFCPLVLPPATSIPNASSFPTKTLHASFIFPMRATHTAHLLLYLNTLIIGEEYTLLCSSLGSFIQPLPT